MHRPHQPKEKDMTYPGSNTRSRPTWPFLTAATVALALAALIAAAHSSASNGIEGIRASLHDRTLRVQGGDGGQQVALRLKAGDPQTIQVDAADDGSADFSFARAGVHSIKVRMGDGNDSARIDDSNGAFTDQIPTTIAGGDGDDSLAGGQTQVAPENETFRGGEGNDLVDGGKGNDTAYLGEGKDTFNWDNGEGSDVIQGQGGGDALVFNGAPGAEQVTMSANGGRLNFFRVQGNVTMDTDGVEAVVDNTLGGADSVTVNDLSGTDVTQTIIDLAGTLGGSAADGAVDNVAVNGTNGDDSIALNANFSGGAEVSGLASGVSVTHADPTDTLSVNTLAGNDNVAASGVFPLQVLVDGVGV
jgi:RTX calcium-binding nonapeptide repeat (4 copies)